MTWETMTGGNVTLVMFIFKSCIHTRRDGWTEIKFACTLIWKSDLWQAHLIIGLMKQSEERKRTPICLCYFISAVTDEVIVQYKLAKESQM